MNLEDPDAPTSSSTRTPDESMQLAGFLGACVILTVWACVGDTFRGNFMRNVVWMTAFACWTYVWSFGSFRYPFIDDGAEKLSDACVAYVGCFCTGRMETCNPNMTLRYIQCVILMWMSPYAQAWCALYLVRSWIPTFAAYVDGKSILRSVELAFAPFFVTFVLTWLVVVTAMGLAKSLDIETSWDPAYPGNPRIEECMSSRATQRLCAVSQ